MQMIWNVSIMQHIIIHLLSLDIVVWSAHVTATLSPTDMTEPSCTGTASQPKKVVLFTAPPRYTGMSAYFPNLSNPKCLPVLKSFIASIGCDPLSAVSCSTKGTCNSSHTLLLRHSQVPHHLCPLQSIIGIFLRQILAWQSPSKSLSGVALGYTVHTVCTRAARSF